MSKKREPKPAAYTLPLPASRDLLRETEHALALRIYEHGAALEAASDLLRALGYEGKGGSIYRTAREIKLEAGALGGWLLGHEPPEARAQDEYWRARLSEPTRIAWW